MAENFHAVSPVIERCTILVSIPLKNNSEHLTSKANIEHDSILKTELGKARALLKHSESYGAKLEKMYNEKNRLKLVLSFSCVKNMLEFRDTMALIFSSIPTKDV